MTMARTLFHATVTIYHVWFNLQLVLLSVNLVLNVPGIFTDKGTFGGMQFLSIWAEVMQQAFFWMALRADIAELKAEMELCNRLRNWCDVMFKYIVIPLSTIVCVNFWVLFGLLNWQIEDMNIIQEHVPFWLNHCLHSVIVLLNLGELVLEPRHFPLQNGVVGSALLVVFYAAWICAIKVIAGKWPYPYFSNFSINQLRMYAFGNIIVSASSYVIAAEINKRIWRKGGLRSEGEVLRGVPVPALYIEVTTERDAISKIKKKA